LPKLKDKQSQIMGRYQQTARIRTGGWEDPIKSKAQGKPTKAKKATKARRKPTKKSAKVVKKVVTALDRTEYPTGGSLDGVFALGKNVVLGDYLPLDAVDKILDHLIANDELVRTYRLQSSANCLQLFQVRIKSREELGSLRNGRVLLVNFLKDFEDNFPPGYYKARKCHVQGKGVGLRFLEKYEKLGNKKFAGFIE